MSHLVSRPEDILAHLNLGSYRIIIIEVVSDLQMCPFISAALPLSQPTLLLDIRAFVCLDPAAGIGF